MLHDHSIRARRRQIEDSAETSINFDDHDQKKSLAAPNSNSFSFNPLSTVFNASVGQRLTASYQEAFSSSHVAPSADRSADFTRSDSFPELSVFGSLLDRITFVMPSRDRTSEFLTCGKSYQMKAQGNGHRPPERSQILQESVHFNKLAKKIGQDLSQTCAKMEKLAEMARNKSIFDERSGMEHMSRVVKEDITALNKQIAALQEFSRRKAAGIKSQGAGHNQQVVVGLQSKLASVSKDFQSVLELNTETMKQQKSRRDMFSHSEAVPFSLPSSSSSPNVRSRLLVDDENHRSSSTVLDMNGLEPTAAQAQQFAMRDQSHDYISARSSAMETIESSISELGQIFTQLGQLVSEQGEMITRIDSNVDETTMNIDAAHSELVKYFHNISRNRWLMLKIFAVLMAFFVVFVVFLA